MLKTRKKRLTGRGYRAVANFADIDKFVTDLANDEFQDLADILATEPPT